MVPHLEPEEHVGAAEPVRTVTGKDGGDFVEGAGGAACLPLGGARAAAWYDVGLAAYLAVENDVSLAETRVLRVNARAGELQNPLFDGGWGGEAVSIQPPKVCCEAPDCRSSLKWMRLVHRFRQGKMDSL